MRRLAPIVLFLACSTPIGLPFALSACTPAARQQAAAVVSTLAPALCATLSAVTGPDGSTVGLVCADVAKMLSMGLAVSSPTSSITRTAAATKTCTPLYLKSVDPGRDPTEWVCAEAFGGEQAARLKILDALAMGHAR